MLSDVDIIQAMEGDISIQPFKRACLQPASYDMHLGSKLTLPFIIPQPKLSWGENLFTRLGLIAPRRNINIGDYVDPGSANKPPMRTIELPPRDDRFFQYYLPPGGVALGYTSEVLQLRDYTRVAADIAGCSSLGRLWLFVHVTAGFIDPGWSGQLTLELFNASPWYIRLWSGMRIAQLRFYRLESMPLSTYSKTGAYNGSVGAVQSRYRG